MCSAPPCSPAARHGSLGRAASEEPGRAGRLPGQHRLADRSGAAQSERRAGLQCARQRARPRRPQPGSARRLRPRDRARCELRAGLRQPRPGAPPDEPARSRRSPTTTRRSRSIRTMRPAYLGRGQVYRAQGRALDALNDYNRAIQMTPEQRAGLLQSRPALSGAGPAQVRGRRFLHRDRADPAAGRALHRARPEPPRARRHRRRRRATSTTP